MKHKVLFIFLFCSQFSSFGQFSNAARDSINKLTQSDFIQMLDQLGIKESDLRPGPSGNPSAKEGKTPLVIQLGFIRSPFGLPQEPAIGLGSPHEPNWKEQLLAKGWGFAILVPGSIQADHGAGLRSGIIGLANRGQHRKPMHINF
jgi:hypothetical protein